MGLTMGTGPFGKQPAGTFNFEPDAPKQHALYLEPSPRRVRGVIGGETVVDSTDVALLHETGYLPIWYFPRSDVRFDLLEATDHTTHCPFKGDAQLLDDPRGRQGRREQGLGLSRDPARHAPTSPTAWRSTGTPSSTGTRRTRRSSSTRATRTTASTSCRARAPSASRWTASCWPSRAGRWPVFETNLPTRWYLPKEDIVADYEATTRSTRCPYKGTASYWSVGGNDEHRLELRGPDRRRRARCTGLVAFYDEVVDVDIDGERQERGYSPFAGRALKDRGVAAQVGSNA